jgi:predicted N-acyltransferase
MNLKWGSFEDYLMDSKWRLRQHYKRSSREAADLGIRVTRHTSVGNINTALELIHNVEQRHNSMPNPGARDMLENMGTAESVWLEAYIGERLVGCLLLLEDNGVQIATLPGLTDDVPFAYFMLLYEAIQDAFDKKLIVLRWGSGAYETKRRLGFELEDNNNVIFYGINPVLRLAIRRMAT